MSDERPQRPSDRGGPRRQPKPSQVRRPAARPPEPASPRAAAQRVLHQVLDRRRPLEEAIAEEPAWAKIHGRL